MPIRPENRDRYPTNWPEISRTVKDRAGWRCECLGECGRPTDHLSGDGRCRNRHGAPAWRTGSMVVLTTAHLDHTPEHCDWDNLRAMCQGCHLHYDRDHHAETRQARRAAEQADQAVSDRCPTGCGRDVNPADLMCEPCWQQVPDPVRSAVWHQWERYFLFPTADHWTSYAEARDEAIRCVK